MADDLRRRITTGVLRPGSRLPSEEELASGYDVGKPTLRRALEVLQGEGLVEKFHGRGNFVRQPGPPITYAIGGRLPALPEPRPALDIDLSVTQVEASGSLAELLGVPVGTPLVECLYLSAQEGARCSLARVYLPLDLGVELPSAGRSPWGDDIREQLADAGIELSAPTERVAARFPTQEEADALRITVRTCVLTIERTSIDTAGRVVECAVLVLPGDRAQAVFTATATGGTQVVR